MYVKYTGTLDSACTITIAPNTINRMQFIENGTSGSQNIIIKQGSGTTITIPPGDAKAVYLDGAGSGAAVVDAFASLSVVDLKVQDDLTVTDDATIGGTLGVTGIVTLTDDLIIGDGKTIGSASDVDAITIAANGQLTLTQTLIGTALDISGDIDVDGTANLDVVDIDGAVDMASTLQVDGAITSSAGATITVADNSNALSLVSTDADNNEGPVLRLMRDSSSPADGDSLGRIYFSGDNDAGEEIQYVRFQSILDDASDGTEDSSFRIQTYIGGAIKSKLFTSSTETVFNDDSVDLDFRVESDNDASAFFVQGSDGMVGIGTNAPGDKLHVRIGTNLNWHFGYPSSNTTSLVALNDAEGAYVEARIDALPLNLNSQSGGKVGIGITDPASQLHVDKSFSGTLVTFHNTAGSASTDRGLDVETSTTGSTVQRWLNGGSELARITGSGAFVIGNTSIVNSAAVTVQSNNNLGLVVGQAGTNSYRNYRHIVATGIHTFASSNNSASLSNAGAWTNASDIAYKNNIVDTVHGLETIKQLQPRDYKLKADNTEHTGFIAQELETVLPQFVIGEEGHKNVNYAQITAVLTKAMKELEARVTTLEG